MAFKNVNFKQVAQDFVFLKVFKIQLKLEVIKDKSQISNNKKLKIFHKTKLIKKIY
jgi:hypothetical protein